MPGHRVFPLEWRMFLSAMSPGHFIPGCFDFAGTSGFARRMFFAGTCGLRQPHIPARNAVGFAAML
jgi:hypothetical protein